MNHSETLGERIYFYRTKAKLSQKALAEKLQIAKSTMSQYESNERRPSDDIKVALCNIFNISLDELLGRTSPQPEKKQPKDLTKFLENTEVMFDGEVHHLDEEDRQKLKNALEYVVWQAKERNKRCPKK